MEDKKPLITVMLPSYNHEKYIAEAIESVLSQSYSKIELLIADDGSTDHSLDIIGKYQDSRIKTFFMKENTCFKTWDLLRDEAKGKYVTYLGSDDVWEADKLEKQVEFLETHPEYQACFTWAVAIDSHSQIMTDGAMEACFSVENRTREEWIRQLTCLNNCLVAPSVMMERGVFLKLNGFQMSYRQIPDWDLWLRFLMDYQFFIIQRPLVRYRVHPNEACENVSTVSETNSIRMNQEHSYMISNCIIQMKSELFKKAFYHELVNKDAENDIELLCEKCFWLLNHFSAGIQTKGMDFYLEHSFEPEFLECMEKNYSFTRRDFFELETQKGMAKVLADSQENERQCAEMAEKAISYLEALQAQGR